MAVIVRQLAYSQRKLWYHSTAHLLCTDKERDQCDIIWVEQNSALTSGKSSEILRIAFLQALVVAYTELHHFS